MFEWLSERRHSILRCIVHIHCDVVVFRCVSPLSRTWPIRVNAVVRWKLTSRRVTVSNLGVILAPELVWEILLLVANTGSGHHPASRQVRIHPKPLTRSPYLLQLLQAYRWRWRALDLLPFKLCAALKTYCMGAGPHLREDRKSTRLNSSHGGISRMPSSA